MKRINFEMFSRKLTTAELARRTGLSKALISNIINGHAEPSFKKPSGMLIAEALGWEGDPHDLFAECEIEVKA